MNFFKFEVLFLFVCRILDIFEIVCVCGIESFNVYMKLICCNISIFVFEVIGLYIEFIVSRNNFVIVFYKVFIYYF